VRWTDGRPGRCCTLVAKAGSIKVRICLFSMVTLVRLGSFSFGFESLGYDKCLNSNFEFWNFKMELRSFEFLKIPNFCKFLILRNLKF
jgi:hypothetical protein